MPFLPISTIYIIKHRLSKYIQGKFNLVVIVVNLMCSRIWLDVRQNKIELSAVNRYTRVVQGFQGIGFVMNIVTVDSATCIGISISAYSLLGGGFHGNNVLM